MIRVFVVDDEKLVRRGIIGLIDWEKYGMEVVGDSGNSQETLEFLKREEVDLLFSAFWITSPRPRSKGKMWTLSWRASGSAIGRLCAIRS